MAASIKRNDRVVIITGAEKGHRGRVLHVDRVKERVLVEGINIRKKARRRTPDAPQGGIDDIECPVHISNVMLEEKYNARHPEIAAETATKQAEETADES